MRRRRATALLVLATVAVVGCGAEERSNDPRPPTPVELTARIDDRKVVVSPNEIGAGLANITISNQSSEDVELEFVGPDDGRSGPISAGGVSTVKLPLATGDYEVVSDVSSISPGTIAVGPERPSAQNDLLLP